MQFSRRWLSAALTSVAFGAAAIVAIGLLSGGPSSAATTPRLAANHSVASHTAARPPVIIDCLRKGQVRPSNFIFTCADANSGLTRMQWPTWGSSAYGTGTYFQNDCVPNCAEGKMFYFPTVVVLWRPQPLPHSPAVQYFTRMTQILTGRHCLPAPGGKRLCLPVTSTVHLSTSGGIS
jgi:hypothetical protein